MPTKKIADLPSRFVCRHPEHNPPGHCVFPPGVYEHTCPGCGDTQQFTVDKPMLSARRTLRPIGDPSLGELSCQHHHTSDDHLDRYRHISGDQLGWLRIRSLG